MQITTTDPDPRTLIEQAVRALYAPEPGESLVAHFRHGETPTVTTYEGEIRTINLKQLRHLHPHCAVQGYLQLRGGVISSRQYLTRPAEYQAALLDALRSDPVTANLIEPLLSAPAHLKRCYVSG